MHACAYIQVTAAYNNQKQLFNVPSVNLNYCTTALNGGRGYERIAIFD